MLFKSLGFITSMGNLAVIMGLIYNDTILDFNTAHWNVGVGSLLFLSGLSVLFFWLNNQKDGINALKLYGGVYSTIALFTYGYWGIKNLFFETQFREFFALGLIFSAFLGIGFLSIISHQKHKGQLLKIFSSILSILTVVMSFGVIYKYVLVQQAFEFDNLILELFVIMIGAVLFISTYSYAEKHT